MKSAKLQFPQVQINNMVPKCIKAIFEIPDKTFTYKVQYNSDPLVLHYSEMSEEDQSIIMNYRSLNLNRDIDNYAGESEI